MRYGVGALPHVHFFLVKLGVHWASCAERGTADRLPLERLPRLAFAHNRRIYLPKTALAAHASLCPSFSAHTYLKRQLQPLQITNLQSEDLTLQKA